MLLATGFNKFFRGCDQKKFFCQNVLAVQVIMSLGISILEGVGLNCS